MIFYYLYMGLVITALVLWTIIAVREDGNGNDDSKNGHK